MARYIDADLLLKDISESVVFSVRSGFISPEMRGARKVIDRIENALTADVVEKRDCDLCIFNSRHATEYPCSHCKNCYTDKFKPCEERRDAE